MAVQNHTIHLSTQGFNDIHDITMEIKDLLRESGMEMGTVTVFVPGSTASVTTIEYESGALEDLKKAVERMAPRGLPYHHDARWGDGNGFSHVRAALLGPSLSVPFVNGTPILGTWQQIIFMDFDNRPRERDIVVQILGE